MLKQILETEYNLQIIDYQCVKTIDTLVFYALTADQKGYNVKLYREHNRDLVLIIKETAAFLNYIKDHTNLVVQAPPLPHFPLVNWENERRYVVVSEWIEGDLPEKLDADVLEKLGETMAQLHNAAESFDKQLPILRLDNALIQGVKPKVLARKKWLKFTQKQLNQAFLDIENTFKSRPETPSVFGLIHSDLHRKNLLLNGEILSPIDFDELAYGHYLMDMAIVFNELPIFEKHTLPKNEQKKIAKELTDCFCKGYEKHRPLPADFETQIIEFQRIANALYLNWILNDGNEDLLLDKKLLGYARLSLKQLLG